MIVPTRAHVLFNPHKNPKPLVKAHIHMFLLTELNKQSCCQLSSLLDCSHSFPALEVNTSFMCPLVFLWQQLDPGSLRPLAQPVIEPAMLPSCTVR